MRIRGHVFVELASLGAARLAPAGFLRCDRCGCVSVSYGAAPWYLPLGARDWVAVRPECVT